MWFWSGDVFSNSFQRRDSTSNASSTVEAYFSAQQDMDAGGVIDEMLRNCEVSIRYRLCLNRHGPPKEAFVAEIRYDLPAIH
ncbi:unnamed protein product [Allacma fusca]|uniref:Uncharacterized protein n=1 Tax=Allacma fusca TaxID=39272 RepID=A0A8J2K2P6_9HEXA|nr:unnamed protein product [Allacma fusca]